MNASHLPTLDSIVMNVTRNGTNNWVFCSGEQYEDGTVVAEFVYKKTTPEHPFSLTIRNSSRGYFGHYALSGSW